MKTRPGIAIVASLMFALGMTSASALPKAAEDIDSPVTTVADVPRPKTLSNTPAKKAPGAQVKAAKKGKKAKPAAHRTNARRSK